MIVKVIGATAGQQIAAQAIAGPAGLPASAQTSVSKTLTVPAAVPINNPAGLGFGEGPFGTSPFGGVAPSAELDLTMDLHFIANNCRLILAGQGQLRIRGLEYHVKDKARTRGSIYA